MNFLVYKLAEFCPYGQAEQSSYLPISRTGFPYFEATPDVVVSPNVANCIAISSEETCYITTFSLRPKSIDFDINWPKVSDIMTTLNLQYPHLLHNPPHLLRTALLLDRGSAYSVAKDDYSSRIMVIGQDSKLIDLEVTQYTRKLPRFPIDFL